MHRLLSVAFALALVAQPALAQTPGIHVEGTTNLSPMLAQAATAYRADHPDLAILVHGTSSGAGIASLRNATIDVAASDVAIDDPSFVGTTIGAVGFAFVANPADGVKNLTRNQLIDIYSGKIKNWKDVGGNDCAIVLIGRDIGTGTRLILEEKVAKTLIPTRTVEKASQMMKAVESTSGALGYVASGFIHGDQAQLIVKYEGVTPTVDNIRNHTYLFATDEHLYVRSGAGPEVRAFVAHVAADKALLGSFGVY